MIEQVDIRVGKYAYPVTIARDFGRIYFKFNFNRGIMDEIKCMEGSRWHPETDEPTPLGRKVWSIADSQRNQFQLDFLTGKNPYAHYDKPLIEVETKRPLRDYQIEGKSFVLTRHYCILAYETGTGKTLIVIESMEDSGYVDWWYVAPKSALMEIDRQFGHWNFKINPKMMTYEGLKKILENWGDKAAPIGVVFDESQRAKTPTAQRSQAAKWLADAIRKEHKEYGYVVLLTGTPAPKSPVDWWHQCEIACPGFLREGTYNKFSQRLGLFKEGSSLAGGTFLQHVTWLDNEHKCKECGLIDTDIIHNVDMPDSHVFVSSKNEVSGLYRRMKGLVLVKMKKDCLSLPDKQYEIIKCKPSPAVLRAAKMVTANAKSAAVAMVLLRELSDGFQYESVPEGKETCKVCDGTQKYWEPNEEGDPIETECPHCKDGEVDRFVRKIKEVPCPKDDVLRNLMDKYFDVGRGVVYAGFTGSVDRCTAIALKEKWTVIRADGRGWFIFDGETGQRIEGNALGIFQDKLEEFPRVLFVGHPAAAGEGLTLHASPWIFYFSNTTNGKDRMQSEDRIHRLGMDENRGATIYDCFNLPTDESLWKLNKEKKRLQSLTLGELEKVLDSEEALF